MSDDKSFAWRAVDKDGQKYSGNATADSLESVKEALSEQGLTPIDEESWQQLPPEQLDTSPPNHDDRPINSSFQLHAVGKIDEVSGEVTIVDIDIPITRMIPIVFVHTLASIIVGMVLCSVVFFILYLLGKI